MVELAKKGHRPSLGRGLSALISTNSAVALQEAAPQVARVIPVQVPTADKLISRGENSVQFLETSKIRSNPSQPRKDFKESELNDLARSIKELGVLQPVLVRPLSSDDFDYEIVAGERRWRAAQIAGITTIPAIVKTLSDKETLEISIVENVQRENLNPIEEAYAYQRLVDEFQYTHNEIAERVSKDRSSIANALRLLKLPKEILSDIAEGKLSVGHAKAILGIKEPSAQLSLARKAISEELSVRELESIVARVVVLDTGKKSKTGTEAKQDHKRSKEDRYQEIVDQLRNIFGTKVNIQHKRSGKGKIEIEYFSEEELSRVVELLLHREAVLL